MTTENPQRAADAPIPLAIWGPSSAGKTVLLAQLYLEIQSQGGEWTIRPTAESLKFIDRMQEWRVNNRFPPATPVGEPDRIVYVFHNQRTGVRASLQVEDRAGTDYEKQEPEARRRLNAAAGLVLLVDPFREQRHLQLELRRLMDTMYVEREDARGRDPRPIAVCISKADVLIESPSDLERARLDPDGFVRDRDCWNLVPLLERFCGNYRLFPVSGVGVNLNFGVVEPNIFYDESFRFRVGNRGIPFNLLAPFSWLIARITDNT